MINEPFPELEEMIDHLTSPEIVAQRKKQAKRVMSFVWELRFWEGIMG